MKRSLKHVIVSSVALVLVAAGCAESLAQSESSAPSRRNVISVTGSGTTRVKADAGTAVVGASATHRSLAAAIGDVSRRIHALTESVKGLGVEAQDITTVQYTVVPVAPSAGAAISSYSVVHIVRVTVRDLNRLGPVVDAATAAGANIVHSVSLGLVDEERLTAEARAIAISDASRKALQLAQAAGVRLGKIVEITERPLGPDALQPGRRPAPPDASRARPDEIEVAVVVDVRYAIAPLISPLSRVFPPIF